MSDCRYCTNKLDVNKACSEWDDLHHEDHHYNGVSCEECGKKNWVRVDHLCSGHDNIFIQKPSVDSILRKVHEQ